MDELEAIIEQAWSTGPVEGSHKAPATPNNESVACLTESRTPTEREGKSNARSLTTLRQPPASSYSEGSSNRQQRTGKSAQLESPPTSSLLTPQANGLLNSEDGLMDEIEGTLKETWSPGPIDTTRKASVARNNESVVCLADCYTPMEREDEVRAQSSPMLRRPLTPCYDKAPSNGQPCTRQASLFESPPASLLQTPQANDYVDSEDERVKELEEIVQRACSTGLSEAEPTLESDCESVVCLSDSPAPTQREDIRHEHPLLRPPGQCSPERLANCQERPCETFQQDSASALSLWTPHINVSVTSEGDVMDEIEEILEQARPIGNKAENRSATDARDCDSVVCLSDGPAPMQGEGFSSDLRLPPPPAPQLFFAEVPAGVRPIQYRMSWLESPLDPATLTPSVFSFHGQSNGNMLGEMNGDVQQAWSTTFEAGTQRATIESDKETIVCLSDCSTSENGEAIRPAPPTFPHLPPQTLLYYGEGPWNCLEDSYQAWQNDASFASSNPTQNIPVYAEGSTPTLPATMRLTQTGHDASGKVHCTRTVPESGGTYGNACHEKPSVSFSPAWHNDGR